LLGSTDIDRHRSNFSDDLPHSTRWQRPSNRAEIQAPTGLRIVSVAQTCDAFEDHRDDDLVEPSDALVEIYLERIAHLEVALLSARRIGAAIGILMATRKVTEDEAFELLRAASQAWPRKLRVVADDVVLTGTLEVPPRR
jgi:hypothetical protein